VLRKEFPGGVLILTGANSAVGLRSMPARYLFLDEVDGYPGDVEGEGDPILLAERRSATFQRRKILLVSTLGSHFASPSCEKDRGSFRPPLLGCHS
jgi:phage terminase large subunit GpA-like protein